MCKKWQLSLSILHIIGSVNNHKSSSEFWAIHEVIMHALHDEGVIYENRNVNLKSEVYARTKNTELKKLITDI